MCEQNLDSIPWIEKYRPKKLWDMVQSNELLDLFQNNINTGHMTHYIFYGPPGTGKTSAILAMGREIFEEYFPSRVIEFNASDDRGIGAVREKISNEAKKYVSEIVKENGKKIPPYKIIILDEADSMTDEAQDALRVIIEKYSTVTRFCFICNYISKITDAIKSRCSAIYFKRLTNECMVKKLNDISKKEKIVLSKNIINTVIEVSNGDMRKAIMMLQNLKYLYEYKKDINRPINDISIEKINFMSFFNLKKRTSEEIVKSDIYEIAASISIEKANEIIEEIFKCNNIKNIIEISRSIIRLGYPIDNIISQINNAMLISKKLNNEQKSQIIKYSGNIFFKMKNCANEHIQLSDYLACIYGTKKGIHLYT